MKIHMKLDIKGALMNWAPRHFKGMFKEDNGRAMGPREAKEKLLAELQKGNNFIPFGDCDGFDPIEKGCPGHVEAK